MIHRATPRRARVRPSTPVVLTIAFCAAAAAAACGKRGAPLAPIVRIPAAVDKITAARVGSDVYVTLTVPTTNIDASIPGDVGQIEVYGYTGRVPPPLARWVELGDLIAAIPVAPPPFPDQPVPAPAPGYLDPAGAVQGTPVTVRDTLTEDELVQGREPPVDPRRARRPLPVAIVTPPAGALKRFYLAIPYSRRGTPGPPGLQTELSLTALPDPPTAVRAAYADTAIALAWEPSGGLLGFLLDKPLPPEPSPFDQPAVLIVAAGLAPVDPSVPPGPTTYNVYRDVAPDPLALPPEVETPSWSASVPLPVNPAPLATMVATDVVDFGRQHCYTVHAIRGAAPPVMSEPSTPVCLTPVDTFPPATPSGLEAVPSEGGISLIWEPNGDLDLGGYLVLRREGGDATLRQLTESPIVEARFRDTDVKPGTRYVYSVVAVDSQLPLPNVSAESERVEETAR